MPEPPCDTTGSAADFLPARKSLRTLAQAAQACRGCSLYCNATQAVFGEGPREAGLFLIGEQPGDQEDRSGHPFVGPAGRLLDACLQEAGIDRARVYVTNAVKHFKFTPRGKRRMHAKPSWTEITDCKPWLIEELLLIKPAGVVTLGATAAQTLLGKTFRLTQHRGEFQNTPHAPWLLATIHPSALLRVPGDAERRAAIDAFQADLQLAAQRAGMTKN